MVICFLGDVKLELCIYPHHRHKCLPHIPSVSPPFHVCKQSSCAPVIYYPIRKQVPPPFHDQHILIGSFEFGMGGRRNGWEDSVEWGEDGWNVGEDIYACVTMKHSLWCFKMTLWHNTRVVDQTSNSRFIKAGSKSIQCLVGLFEDGSILSIACMKINWIGAEK